MGCGRLMQTKGIIFTSAPENGDIALREFKRLFPNFRFVDWLAPGVGLFDSDGAFKSVFAKARGGKLAFVRHIFPHQVDMVLKGDPSDLAALVAAADSLLESPEEGDKSEASVQTRILTSSTVPYGRFDVNQALAGVLEAKGWTLDVKDPKSVLSLIITDAGKVIRAYMGFSEVRSNLSGWAGGEMRFQREDERISRAEFKLLEAFDVFGLVPQNGGKALDLGAAPGGWTRILRMKGLTVEAVDPAKLDPRMVQDPGVIHHSMTSQEFLPKAGVYDVIVNDMRMDARDSSRIMGDVAGCLSPGGFGVITLKLPEGGHEKTTKQALEILSKWYSIRDARQLFHNRSEVTVILDSRV